MTVEKLETFLEKREKEKGRVGGRDDRENLEERVTGEVGTVKVERDNGAELKTWRRDGRSRRGLVALENRMGKKKYDHGQEKWYQLKLLTT